MIQIIVFGVVAFLLGVGGGAGFRIMTAPKAVAGAHGAADSTGVAHGADSTHAADSLAHAVLAHAADSSRAQAHDAPAPGATATQAPAARGEAHAEPAASNAPTEPQRFKQVGGILLAMKPEEAGKILAYLSDDHVEGILRSMGPRQAATVLAQIPSARAAQLSRRLLVASDPGGAQ